MRTKQTGVNLSAPRAYRIEPKHRFRTQVSACHGNASRRGRLQFRTYGGKLPANRERRAIESTASVRSGGHRGAATGVQKSELRA